MNSLQVICHDEQKAISGTLRCITESGCELVSSIQTASPLFARRTPVLLNLLNPKTGQSVNVRGRLCAVIRQNGQWIYRVNWEKMPELLAA